MRAGSDQVRMVLNRFRFRLTCTDLLEARTAEMDYKTGSGGCCVNSLRGILWRLPQLSFKNLLWRWMRTGKQPIHMVSFLVFSTEIPFAHFAMAVSALAFLSYDIVLSFGQEVKVIYP